MSEEVKNETAPEETTAAPAAEGEAGEQLPLIPDEIKEEEDVREVLIKMQPHEMIDAFESIFVLHREVKDLQAQEEAEKTRHKEEKDRIASALETAEMKRSNRLDQAETGMRKELMNTTKRINFTTKMVSWHDRTTGEKYDERPMTAAEHQVKLALAPPNPDNVVSLDQALADQEKDDDKQDAPPESGEAAGDDPATFDEPGEQLDPSEEETGD